MSRFLNWLRAMGPFRPGAFAWIASGALLTALLVMGAWFEASLVAGVIGGALVLTFLRRGDGTPMVYLTWATSWKRARHKAPSPGKFETDAPLIGVLKGGDGKQGYAWVEYDPETSTWSIFLRILRWYWIDRFQYFGELTSEEFALHVQRLGLQFLAQDFYAKAVWEVYFED